MKRAWKKIILVMTAGVLLTALLLTAIPVFAADSATLTVPSSVKPGETVTVTVGYQSSKQTYSATLIVTYDSTLLTPKGNDAKSANIDTITPPKNGQITILVVADDPVTSATQKLQFTVSASAKSGATPFVKVLLQDYSDASFNLVKPNSSVEKKMTVSVPVATPTKTPAATPTKTPVKTPTKAPATPTKTPAKSPTKAPATPTKTPAKSPTKTPDKTPTAGTTADVQDPEESENPEATGENEETAEPTESAESVIPVPSVSPDGKNSGSPTPGATENRKDQLLLQSGAFAFWLLVSLIIGVWVGIGVGFLIWGRSRGRKVRRTKVIGNEEDL